MVRHFMLSGLIACSGLGAVSSSVRAFDNPFTKIQKELTQAGKDLDAGRREAEKRAKQAADDLARDAARLRNEAARNAAKIDDLRGHAEEMVRRFHEMKADAERTYREFKDLERIANG